ncbi:MAG TPA: inositol 2-dehydrogenase [Anaerolineae bacterium]|nr:inositol 2-dehydrogenase [Anaerolineae bacterium]
MADKINVGVIGAGRIGRVHAENLVYRMPEARLAGVSDVFVEAAERLAGELGGVPAYQDPRRILDDPDVDAVLICSSTDTHAPLIEQAAQAGKQIFCEKPIALELAAIDRALAAADEAGVKLQIGFNRRFDPNFGRVHDLVAAGEVGTPHLLRITSRDPAPPPIAYVRVSGGIFLDMMIHDFDMARFLMPGEVESVYAAAAVLVDPAIGEAGDVDTAIVTLHFDDGSIGAIDNSRQAVYGYDQRVEVFGSGGSVSADNAYPNTVMLGNAHRVQRDLPLNFFMDRYVESYVRELRAFISAVLDDVPPPVTGHDGRVPVVIGYAAKKSVAEGRPVKLSEVNA